jgi:hypothetical protein
MTDITWDKDDEHWHTNSLNGWWARVWDFSSDPDIHPDGKPFHWGVRPTITFEEHDREGYATTLDKAKADAEQNLRELAAKPAEQDDELVGLLCGFMPPGACENWGG